MYAFGIQSYKKIVHLALKAEKLTVKDWHGESFKRERVLALCLVNFLKGVKVLNFLATHLDSRLILSALHKPFDLHNHLD